MRRDSKYPKLQMAGGMIVSTFAFSLCFLLSYLLTGFLYRYTGRPSTPFTYIINGILGLYLFAGGIKIIVDTHGKNHKHRRPNQMMEEMLEAMKKIAQGDFSVVMSVEEHNPFSELAESVNKMAQELGTMENLRQDFIANVSHEIQSPLTSISGFAGLLRNNSITDQERLHYIDIIEAESKRLSKLSDNLLKLSSLDANATPLSFTKFRLDKQIRNALLMLEPQWAEKSLDISLDLENITVSGDSNLMTQIWINLLHNAIKFTTIGGNIAITLTSDEDNVLCLITDSGIGITDEDKLHIFERFYKVDKARDRELGGSGLGLSLVKKIVDLHQGTIIVESEIGVGTTFRITLPR